MARELTREEKKKIRTLVTKWCANYDKEYLDDWESVSFDDKRKVVDILISQIDATSESVTIHWKI